MHEAASGTAPGTSAGRPTALCEAYIFDLDGTVYLGEQLLPGAARLLSALRRQGKRIAFVSNNPTHDVRDYVAKLEGMGVEAHDSEVVTTVHTMTAWLAANHPGARVFPIAEEPLVKSLVAAGIEISDDPSVIDIVVASYDRAFDYRKLQVAFDALRFYKRARLVSTNLDLYCPMPGGRGEPDAGAIVAAIEACSGVLCELNAGKPSPLMLEAALGALGVDASACMMVGDRLYTDIKMAKDAGMAAALVLTGDTTAEALAASPVESRPDYVVERLDWVMPERCWAGLGWSAQN